MKITKIGILYHPIKKAARDLAEELATFLTAEGVPAWTCSAWEEEEARGRLNGTDLILTTGGDGTILHAVQVSGYGRIPITGVNLGRLGFMTELRIEEAKANLLRLVRGEGWIDERAMLEAEVSLAGETPMVYHALNDVVIARGAVARMIYVEAAVNGEPLTTYRADGVIVASATGSTGYSLAAGGPILHPQSRDFIMLPISPHLSSDYCLVLPAAAVVKLRLITTHQATLSIDGMINLPLRDDARIIVKSGPAVTRFLRLHPQCFYGHLEQKLKGKEIEPDRKSQD